MDSLDCFENFLDSFDFEIEILEVLEVRRRFDMDMRDWESRAAARKD